MHVNDSILPHIVYHHATSQTYHDDILVQIMILWHYDEYITLFKKSITDAITDQTDMSELESETEMYKSQTCVIPIY